MSRFRKPLVDHVWKSKDGRVTPLSEMTTEHLLNASAFQERQADKADALGLRDVSNVHWLWVERLTAELLWRGTLAEAVELEEIKRAARSRGRPVRVQVVTRPAVVVPSRASAISEELAADWANQTPQWADSNRKK